MTISYQKDHPHTIQQMFNTIAKRYDLTNSVLSLNMHKRWNRTLVHYTLNPEQSHTFIDLCCGTGDVAFDYLKTNSSPCQAYLVDFSANMLEYAKHKEKKLSLEPHDIHYIQADVQQLPFSDNLADCCTMAYGIRNVQDAKKCIQEAYRVLKPGGRFGILELTRPTYPLLRWGHRLYLKTMLPLFGKWLTNNKEAYQYLKNSIHTFISPVELESFILSAGFIDTYRKSLAGGIATLWIGYKPEHE